MNSALLVLLTAVPAAEQNFPAYRGPYGNGHADAKNLPVEWSEKQNVRWKAPMPGKAWASPVIWGKQVWLSNATQDGKLRSAVALDLESGKVIHDVPIFKVETPETNLYANSYASSTPAIEAGRIYMHYGSIGTACLDTATGRILWVRQDLPCNHWRGSGSSPILHGDLLILTFDGHDFQYVVALDKKTGKTVWKKDRAIKYGTDDGDYKKGYSTPAVFDVKGKQQLVSPTAVATIAYDPATGDEIWKVYHGGMNAACRPIMVQGRVLITTGDFGWKMFAVRPDGKGDVTETHVDWKTNKAVPSRSTPLLVGDVLYMVNEGGLLSSVDPKTGDQLRQQRLTGAFSASPLHVDGRIYLFNEQGTGFVVEPGPQWKVVATNKLESGCMASPAAVGQSLIVRTTTHLYCLEKMD